MFVFSWLLSKWRVVVPVLILAVLFVAFKVQGIRIDGLQREKATLTAKVYNLEANAKEAKAHEKTKQAVFELSDDDLDGELSRWMRD